MVREFQKVMNELVERRIEEVINSKEFVSYNEILDHDLDEKLKQLKQFDSDEAKMNALSDLKDNIFEQVFSQTNIAYKTGFNDAFILAVDMFVMPKKI
ncbi:hypothetical protein [Planomicrobium sp. CPCC 101079]|uniref:hypothetical protein n=1 Tax=Planomicrobium sp. CPCC 101079 TaxID=2599618 RepID=UPI0011B800AB|nr:hypothetical protein [Planomicrobium sp. CPCC 101079]TWT00134.1 hypothetical protein FQV28_18630 [Planomicrobium sp. CPCC 101079]